MQKHRAAKGLDIGDDRQHTPCKICVEANLKHADIPRARTRSVERPLQIVGTDLQEIETRSHGGYKYLAVYPDHATGMLATVPLIQKSDQPEGAYQVLRRMERLAGAKIEILRMDQGGEYTSDEFKRRLAMDGIRLEYSDTNQPFQNGLAETMGGKIIRMMRAARAQSGVPKEYWVENANHQTWLHNRLSLRRQGGWTTPLEAFSGEKADVSRARP